MKVSNNIDCIHQICEEVASFLEDIILDDSKSFPCTMACVHFMEYFFSERKEMSLNSFTPEVVDIVYKELGESLKYKAK